MPSKKNVAQLEDLKTKLHKAKTVVLTDYRGLKVNQLTELKRLVKLAGGEFKVYKNTLLNLGFNEAGLKIQGSDEALTGPTAILLSFEDEIKALKILYDFSLKNELPTIKLGFVDSEFASKDRVTELAQLPDVAVLQAKLTGMLYSPVYGLVYGLKANLSRLLIVLSQIKKAKN